jgi:hypothetical protein
MWIVSILEQNIAFVCCSNPLDSTDVIIRHFLTNIALAQPPLITQTNGWYMVQLCSSNTLCLKGDRSPKLIGLIPVVSAINMIDKKGNGMKYSTLGSSSQNVDLK